MILSKIKINKKTASTHLSLRCLANLLTASLVLSTLAIAEDRAKYSVDECAAYESSMTYIGDNNHHKDCLIFTEGLIDNDAVVYSDPVWINEIQSLC